MRFASFALAPVFFATFDSSGRQISVIFAAVILSPVAVTTVVLFHYSMTSILKRNRFEESASGFVAFDPLNLCREVAVAFDAKANFLARNQRLRRSQAKATTR